MLRLASDEDFNNDIVRGLHTRQPDLDLVRMQDMNLMQANDPMVLAWAAAANRVLLTHDRKTMPGFAYERITQGLPMPGVIVVSKDLSVGKAIDELHLLACCSFPGEWENRVIHLR